MVPSQKDSAQGEPVGRLEGDGGVDALAMVHEGKTPGRGQAKDRTPRARRQPVVACSRLYPGRPPSSSGPNGKKAGRSRAASFGFFLRGRRRRQRGNRSRG